MAGTLSMIRIKHREASLVENKPTNIRFLRKGLFAMGGNIRIFSIHFIFIISNIFNNRTELNRTIVKLKNQRKCISILDMFYDYPIKIVIIQNIHRGV